MRNTKPAPLFEPKEPIIQKRGSKLNSSRGKVISIGGVVFRSDFECGNLESVRIVAPSTYLVDLER